MLGPAVLVAPDVAVIPVDARGSTPEHPLQVLVPVAAGGDRDEPVNVVEIVPAVDGQPLVALRLERACGGQIDEQGVRRLMSRSDGKATIDQASTAGKNFTGSWLCRVFRIC